MTTPKITVLGLGIMGYSIVGNFIKNVYEVFLWNRTPEKAEGLVEKARIKQHQWQKQFTMQISFLKFLQMMKALHRLGLMTASSITQTSHKHKLLVRRSQLLIQKSLTKNVKTVD